MKFPLSGIKVLDVSRVLTGPFCTMIMGDLGAEIIKVETPGVGDDTRAWGPPFIQGESAYFLSINRNKKSITLNLKKEQGKEIFYKLARECDVLIENFLPGTTERLGIDYEKMKSVNPGLVYCSISGYGQDGPYREFPGYDLLLQGVGGLMSITGEDERPPVRIGTALIDAGAGMYAVIGILAALKVKEKTGQGQYIDISLLDSAVSWLTYMASNYFASGKDPRRLGSAHPNIVPYQAYKAKDQYFILAVGNEAIWQRFCTAVGLDIADDPRFRTNELRVQNREELNSLLDAFLGQKEADAWIEILDKHRIPCGPINTISRVAAHPQVKHREMVVELDHPKAGPIKVLGNPIKMSGTPLEVKNPPPLLGQNTEEILQALGYTEADIQALKTAEVV
jgi:formyl-CoA transferase/CoA:oxalate CoA-transferase